MDDSFLDLLSKAQSQRLDDQRSDYQPPTASSRPCVPSDASSRSSQISSEEEDLFDTLWKFQSGRIDEQRCEMPVLSKPDSSSGKSRPAWRDSEDCTSSEELFDLIFASQVRESSKKFMYVLSKKVEFGEKWILNKSS